MCRYIPKYVVQKERKLQHVVLVVVLSSCCCVVVDTRGKLLIKFGRGSRGQYTLRALVSRPPDATSAGETTARRVGAIQNENDRP